jgi:hypothetical protein
MNTFTEFYREKKRMLKEHAVGDYSKRPIKFDQDDWNYLSQFPASKWKQALYDRYNTHLIGTLKHREKQRDDYIEKNGLIDKYFNQFKDEGMSEKDAKNRAKIEAREEAAKAIPHSDPSFDKKTLEFAEPGHGGKKHKVDANMNMNRLIHKLETKYGAPFHPDVATQHGHVLGDTGQYEYDLTGPKFSHEIKKNDDDGIIPNSTKGYKAPELAAIGTKLKDWMNHNSHEMYGKLPKENWKPVNFGSGQSPKETWTVEKKLDELTKQWTKQLQNQENFTYDFLPTDKFSGPTNIPNKDLHHIEKVKLWAKAIARDQLLRQADKGELRGPPHPNNPEGDEIKTTKSFDSNAVKAYVDKHGLVDKYKKAFESQGLTKKQLDIKAKEAANDEAKTKVSHTIDFKYPPLYLPHTTLANGNEVPILNTAKFLRKHGEHPTDVDIPDEDRLGHQKDYVEVPEYQQGSTTIGAAMHPNRNTKGKLYLDPTDPAYKEAKKKLEESMPMKGPYFLDIINGINNAISGEGSGGASELEKTIAKSLMHDLHQAIFIDFLENLRDPKMADSNERFKRARNFTTSFLQQNLGNGTRRRRGLSGLFNSMDAKVKNSSGEGEGANAIDLLFHKIIDKNKKSGEALTTGNRRSWASAGLGAFPYDLKTLRSIVDDANRQNNNTEDMDDVHDSQKAMDELSKRADVVIKIMQALSIYYLSQGMNEEQAEAEVNKYMQNLNSKNLSLDGILSTFKQDFNGKIKEIELGQGSANAPNDYNELIKNQEWLELIKHPQFQKSPAEGGPTINDLRKTFDGIKLGLHNGKYTNNDIAASSNEIKRLKERITNNGAVPAGENPAAQQAPAVAPQTNLATLQKLAQEGKWIEIMQQPAFNLPTSQGGPTLKLLTHVYAKIEDLFNANPHDLTPYVKEIAALKHRIDNYNPNA